jgi:Arabinose efflux permease
MDKSKLWTKDFLIDSMTNLIVYLVYYSLMVSIAIFAMDHFQASAGAAGLASGIFIIGGLVARTFTGRLIDQVGRKKTLYAGLCFFFITTLFYFQANSLLLLMAVRFLHGVGWGISATATGTIIAGIIPHERLGEGTSYYAMSATIASALGPFLGIFLIHRGSFNLILVLACMLLVLCLIAVFFLKVPEAKLSNEQLAEMKRWTLNNFFEAKAIPISVVGIFFGVGISSIMSFLSPYTKTINLVDAGSFFFIIYAATIVLSRPFTGRWFDQKGGNFVMYPAFLLYALGFIILAEAHNGGMFLLAAIFAGLGYGTFISSGQALSVKLSPPHRMGLATSTFFCFVDGGAGIGPLILGLLMPVTGYRGLYLCTAMLILSCIFIYRFVHERKTKARDCEHLVLEAK